VLGAVVDLGCQHSVFLAPVCKCGSGWGWLVIVVEKVVGGRRVLEPWVIHWVSEFMIGCRILGCGVV